MYLSSHILEAGIKSFMLGARTFHKPVVMRQCRVDAQKGYDDDVRLYILRGESENEARKHSENIEDRMARFAGVEIGLIDLRLRQALARYEAGKQLECIRHLLLVLGQICQIIGWNEASHYLNEQNQGLFERNQHETA